MRQRYLAGQRMPTNLLNVLTDRHSSVLSFLVERSWTAKLQHLLNDDLQSQNKPTCLP